MLTVNKVKGLVQYYTWMMPELLVLTSSNDNDLLLFVKFVNITFSLTLPVIQ